MNNDGDNATAHAGRQRPLLQWTAAAALHVLVWSMLWLVTGTGGGRALPLLAATAMSALGLACSLVLTIKAAREHGGASGRIARFQAYQVLFAVAAAYAVATPVRAALLCIPVVALVYLALAETAQQARWYAASASVVLGTEMLALALNDPVAYVPLQEAFHFTLVAGMLAATSLLTCAYQATRNRLQEQTADLRLELGRISLAADLDELTDLPNRRRMKEIISDEADSNMDAGRPLCLILLDIDFFKNINDSYGHAVGDQVLRTFANQAASALRETDVIARWGGEEFLLLLPGAYQADAEAVLERLRERVRAMAVDGLPDALTVTFSAGMAWLTPGMTVNDAITQADRAMYRGKQQGRNASRAFSPELDTDAQWAAALAADAGEEAPEPPRLAVLIVEADDMQRQHMLALLEELHMPPPFFAYDGYSALTRLAQAASGVQVVVTDLDTPGMDGIEFIRQLGEARIQVSVVLVSAATGTVLKGIEKVAHAYGITLLGVLQKPVRRAPLARVLAAYDDSASAAPRSGASFEQYSVAELREALANQEFEPFFQPKVNAQTGRIRGYEALARWRRPGVGIIPPSAFIDVMEQSGLIDDLTYLMLERSVAACSGWRKLGFDHGISINVAVATLSRVDCAQRILGILKDHDLSPSCVTIEMTESSADATELKTVLANLSRLRINGAGLSIDDYGTGYSSMDRLARIAFTELKIDQSFIAEAKTNTTAMAIMQSSVNVAQVLQLVSVAEGVETQEHWDLIRRTGCELAQGYFISRPVEAHAVPALESEWLRRIQCGDVPTMDLLVGN